MEDTIIRKLRSLMGDGIDTESKVVYLMAEIRKLIDHKDRSRRFLWLKFFCDWALHIRLSGTTAAALLQDVDACVTPQEIADRLGPRFAMDTFRDDLIEFLHSYDLPTEITKIGPWLTFLKLYLEVVRECPLAYSRKIPLKRIDEVLVERIDHPPENVLRGFGFMFTIAWVFKKDGHEVLRWNNQVYYA